MTVTLANDCANAVIESTLIDDYITAGSTSNTLVLDVTKNCASTSTTINLTTSNLTVGSPNSYSLTPTSLSSSSTTLDDGIYYLKLTYTDNVTPADPVNEYYCLLVSCELKCCMISYIADNPTTNIYGLYQALEWISTCSDPDCKCDDGCVIYNRIVKILNNYSTLTNINKTSDCGCS